MNHLFIRLIRQIQPHICKKVMQIFDCGRITDIEVSGQFLLGSVIKLIGSFTEEIFIGIVIELQMVGRIKFIRTGPFLRNSETQSRFQALQYRPFHV